MAEQGLDLAVPSCLHLVSAFLALESPDVLLSLARECGGGTITERVQNFIWNHCISQADEKSHAPYYRSFLKKLICDVESSGVDVLDELYEQYGSYMSSLKDDDMARGSKKVVKCISFLFSDGCYELSSCTKSRMLVVPLKCSLNMLEGDTGCFIWPSSLYLSEFILSFPQIFSNKSCFEVGSGVGLTGICLIHVKAAKVVLSDGDLSSLVNMKLNLELNQLSTTNDFFSRTSQDSNVVHCMHLPWESAMENEFQDFTPDIVLGADVIYDPVCLPHLIRLLAGLLNHRRVYHHHHHHHNDRFVACGGRTVGDGSSIVESSFMPKEGPVAFIACVIRNVETFNHFLALADQEKLLVNDMTDKIKPFNLLPYMQSYQRSSVRLFSITNKC